MKKVLVNIEATNRCHGRCAMCPREDIGAHGDITLGTLALITRALSPALVHEVSLAGRGEPALHPRLGDLLAQLRATGIPASLVTATGLEAGALAGVAELLDILRVSVSSVDRAVFSAVHRGLDYDRVWANIEGAARLMPDRIVVHLTGGPTIYDTLPETVSRLRALKLRRFTLLPLWNRGGTLKTEPDEARRLRLVRTLQLEAEEGRSGRNYLEDWMSGVAGNSRFCPIGDGSISILFNGEISSCFQDFAGSSVHGTIRNLDLSEYRVARRAVLGKMPICRRCDAVDALIENLASPRRRGGGGTPSQ